MRGRLTITITLTLAALAIAATMPSTAAAHGFFDRTDLPIPQWLFGWAAACVLVVSFAALGTLWSTPKLGNGHWRPLPTIIGRTLAGRPLEILCGAAGAALLAIVVWSGLAGHQAMDHNFAPTFVYVIFWVGLVPASVLFGDVFRAFNPWRAIAHLAAWAARRVAGGRLRTPLSYPPWLGYWPAALTLTAFAALELVAYGGSEPQTIALATIVYSAITFAGMALFGIEQWLERGEGFSVYFNLFSRLSVFERRSGTMGLRPPLTGLATVSRLPGTPFLLAVMIGAVSFDGVSEGPLGQEAIPGLQKAAESFGLGATAATQVALAVGLAAVVLLVLGFYRLGIAGVRRVCGTPPARRLATEFAPTLVPIALAYVAAHYLTLLLYQGQAITFLASDPLGTGSDLFGTAGGAIDHSITSATTIWYAQVGLVVSGHVAGLTLAHDRALVLYHSARQALRSQCLMLAVMVGFTTLALWLLSQANA